MQVGNNFSPYGIDRVGANGQQLPPKMFGKYYRESDDPLVMRQIQNDPTLPWAKEVHLAWHIDAEKGHKGRLEFTRFEDVDAYNAALATGQFFDSPAKAQAAKKLKLTKSVTSLEKELEANETEIKEVIATKAKPGRKKVEVQVAE